MSHRVLDVPGWAGTRGGRGQPVTADALGTVDPDGAAAQAGGIAATVLRSLLAPSAHHSGLPTLELHALLELRAARDTGTDTWQLAERLALGAAATNKLLDRLEHDGLVALSPGAVVQRGDAVRLTGEGKRVATVTLSRLNGAIARALRGDLRDLEPLQPAARDRAVAP